MKKHKLTDILVRVCQRFEHGHRLPLPTYIAQWAEPMTKVALLTNELEVEEL